MKKEYIKPEVELIAYYMLSIIATSPNLEVGDGQVGEGDDGGFTEDAGAVRGDWSDIWGGM